MRRLRAFLTLCIFLLIVFFGVGFTLSNPLLVQPNLILWQTPEMPLGMLMAIMLLIGCGLGVAVNTAISWRLVRQRKLLQQQLDQSQKRFEQLQ
ncbi:MAG: uncharacterized membrane protein YciS (DUF1049 family) [Bermanella sp.]|jgi:uncharacterized membrane protein YciS (DUF1049 family)